MTLCQYVSNEGWKGLFELVYRILTGFSARGSSDLHQTSQANRKISAHSKLTLYRHEGQIIPFLKTCLTCLTFLVCFPAGWAPGAGSSCRKGVPGPPSHTSSTSLLGLIALGRKSQGSSPGLGAAGYCPLPRSHLFFSGPLSRPPSPGSTLWFPPTPPGG